MKLGGICGGDALKSLLMPLTFASSSKNGNFTAKTLKRAKTVPPATQATRLLVTCYVGGYSKFSKQNGKKD